MYYWGSIPGMGNDGIFPRHVQTGSGAQPASCSMGTGALSSPRIKRSGREADHFTFI